MTHPTFTDVQATTAGSSCKPVAGILPEPSPAPVQAASEQSDAEADEDDSTERGGAESVSDDDDEEDVFYDASELARAASLGRSSSLTGSLGGSLKGPDALDGLSLEAHPPREAEPGQDGVRLLASQPQCAARRPWCHMRRTGLFRLRFWLFAYA